MPTVIDSLWVRLGFQTDPKGLEGFAAATEKAKGLMLGFGAAVAGAFYGVKHLVEGASERLGGIQNFSEQMGIGAREVAALGKVARENDSSLEAMQAGLRQMTIMAGQAAQGVGRGAMVFKKFGIQVKDSRGQVKTMDQLLGDVADRLSTLPTIAQKQALGARLGFDAATIKLLSKGRENFDRLRESALKSNPFSDADYEAADIAEKNFKKAGAAVSQLKDRLAVGLFPVANRVLREFTAWVKSEQNVRKLQDAINKVVDVMAALARNVDKVAKVFAVIYGYKLGTYFLSMAENIQKAAKAQALFSGALGGLKALLTGGLIAAIALIVEDLYRFYTGGESVTGWMVQRFPEGVQVMEGALTVLGAALLALVTGSGPVGLVAAGIGGLIIIGHQLYDNWQPIVEWFKGVWDDMADAVARFVNTVTGPLRWVAQQMGIDLNVLKMNEDHHGEHMRDLAADLRARNARAAAGAQVTAARMGGLLPGMGSAMPFLPNFAGASGGGSNTTIGQLHLNIQGDNLNDPEAAKRLMDQFSKQLESRGIGGQSRNQTRGKIRDQQSNVAG